MRDERLLIIHAELVPPPHPHGALTHQAPAAFPCCGQAALPANAAHGVPSPGAVKGPTPQGHPW